VLGNGSGKGALEVGPIYQLVVQRGCAFIEISGTSIGALNDALLAQAAADDDLAGSLAKMRRATEDLLADTGARGRPTLPSGDYSLSRTELMMMSVPLRVLAASSTRGSVLAETSSPSLTPSPSVSALKGSVP
jgi:predicted acylesterase/phospholipase RssA